MKRSSGHARAEIRRRYAIAWVEYIDLSPDFGPVYPDHAVVAAVTAASSSLWISLRHFEPVHPTLSSIVENSRFPFACELHFNSDSPLSMRHPCRSTLLSLVLTMSPLLCPDFAHWSARDISISMARWYYDTLWVFIQKISSCCQKIATNAILTYVLLNDVKLMMINAMTCEIANPYRVSFIFFSSNIFFYYISTCAHGKVLLKI